MALMEALCWGLFPPQISTLAASRKPCCFKMEKSFFFFLQMWNFPLSPIIPLPFLMAEQFRLKKKKIKSNHLQPEAQKI